MKKITFKGFLKWFTIVNVIDIILTLSFFQAEINPLVINAGKIQFLFVKLSSIILLHIAYFWKINIKDKMVAVQ